MAHSTKYLRTLASDAWRELSAFMRRYGRCDACGGEFGKGQLQAHHWHYETLGYEEPWDVSALCVDCHEVADTHRKAIVGAAKAYAEACGDPQWRRAARLVGREYVTLLRRPAMAEHTSIALRGLCFLLNREWK